MMARHLMTVCVVCLLCAQHLPCKQHYDDDDDITTDPTTDYKLYSPKSYEQNDLLNLSPPPPPLPPNQSTFYNGNKRKGRTKAADKHELDVNDYVDIVKKRVRRHSVAAAHSNDGDHDHEHNNNKQSEHFVQQIFKQFGDAEHLTMNVLEFEKMINHLGLYRLIEEQQSIEATRKNHHIDTQEQHQQQNCMSSIEFIKRISTENSYHTKESPTKLITNGHSTNYNNNNSTNNLTTDSTPLSSYSLSAAAAVDQISDKINNNITSNNNQSISTAAPPQPQLATNSSSINSIKKNLSFNSKDFINSICPILLYQLSASTSSERSGCIDASLIPENKYENDIDDIVEENRALVWLYASLSILVASLCGLFGVAVIPFMENKYYNYLLQFLVALAVGTLMGDALLHLLPHAMSTYSSGDNPHTMMTLKGLVAAGGVLFLFVTERALTMIAEWRKRIQKKEKPSSRVRVLRDPDTASVHSHQTGDKLCKNKYSSYPYCYDEINMDTKDDHHHHNREETGATSHSFMSSNGEKHAENHNNKSNCKNNHHHDHNHSDHIETAQSLLPPQQQQQQHNYSISDNYVALKGTNGGGDGGKDSHHDYHDTNNKVSTNVDNGYAMESNAATKLAPEENYTIILREHESKHHGHSHTHGHVHSPPSSLSSVAWMVIMGDGLHNFTDGMAIGAAFSNNIAGGFSTAVAVFCHELPHELGDFAVLLKAGMSAKQAVYYNVLSSVLSFIGTIVGIVIGDTPEASAWIFAGAAGMFIYIALVDMMPELTSSHKENQQFNQLLMQILGISLGVGIMLLIALYEDDLKVLFTADHSSSHGHHHHHHR